MESKYYYTKLQIFPHTGNILHGRIIIYRKDNDEEVTSLNLRHADEEHIKARLSERTIKFFNKLKKPNDFGNRDPVDHILNIYLRYKQGCINIQLYAEDKLENNELEKSILSKCFRDLKKTQNEKIICLATLISELSNTDKVRLISNSKTLDSNLLFIADLLDISYAKLELYEFIQLPSNEITAAHILLKNKFENLQSTT